MNGPGAANSWFPGRNVKELREKQALTQEQLAERTGLTPNGISLIERGERWGTKKTLVRIAVALGVDLNEIYSAYDRKEDVVTPRELVSFFESPQGKGRTPEEEAYLRLIRIPGRRMTETAYTLALAMIRATDPEPDES